MCSNRLVVDREEKSRGNANIFGVRRREEGEIICSRVFEGGMLQAGVCALEIMPDAAFDVYIVV